MPTRRPAPYADPLEGIERLLVDGTNLLHAIRRGAPAAPAATLVGRLRGVIEMPVRIELVFDGSPDPGLRDDRIASGLVVRYSGRMSADALLMRMVGEAVDSSTLLVVTDDVELRREITRRGARTVSALWLIGRLDRSRLASPSIGRPKPPQDPAAGTTGGDPGGADKGAPGNDPAGAPGWRPGRGATTKHGNPKKPPRSPRPGPRP